MSVKKYISILSVSAMLIVRLHTMDQQVTVKLQTVKNETLAALLAPINFDRFFVKNKTGFAQVKLENLDSNAQKACITSAPNIVTQFVSNTLNALKKDDSEPAFTCVIKDPKDEYVAVGFAHSGFAVHGLNRYKDTVFGRSRIPHISSPVTALAQGTGNWDLSNPTSPAISLVIGYQNGSVVLYDFDDGVQKRCLLFEISSDPIHCIAPGATTNTWLFGSNNTIFLCKDENLEAGQKKRPLFHPKVFTLDRKRLVTDIGTNFCNITYKTVDNRYYAIMPYSPEEHQGLFVDYSYEDQSTG
jgi:hypothetical protein